MRSEPLVLSDPREPEGPGAVARPHGLWFCALAAAGAVITLILGSLSWGAFAALAAMAAAGAAGVFAPTAGRKLAVVWTLAAALALSAGGGLLGPSAPWLLTVPAFCMLLRRPLREAAVLTLVAAALYGAAEMFGWAAPRPSAPGESLLLLLSSFGTTAAALVLGLRARRFDGSQWAQRFAAIAAKPVPPGSDAVAKTAPVASPEPTPEKMAAEAARQEAEAARIQAETAEAELAAAEAARIEAAAAAVEAELDLAQAEAAKVQAEQARAHADVVQEELASAEAARTAAQAARLEAEAEFAAAEAARRVAEADFARARAELIASEASRADAEAAQAEAEAQRVAADAARQEAETARRQAETAAAEFADAQTAREGMESALADAQAALAASELARAQAETLRAEAETAHHDLETASDARAQAEFVRLQAHAELAEAETARAEAEAAWSRRRDELAAAEAARAEAEAVRLKAEAELAAAEEARVHADAVRIKAETGRAMADAARAEAEAARRQAEAAQTELAGAEAARAAAEDAWADAERALADAELARSEAEAAQVHARQAREALVRAEAARAEAAEARAVAEADLAQAEIHRAEAEAAWAQAEADVATAEAARAQAEAARAEQAAAEAVRRDAEAALQSARAELAAAQAARAEALQAGVAAEAAHRALPVVEPTAAPEEPGPAQPSVTPAPAAQLARQLAEQLGAQMAGRASAEPAAQATAAEKKGLFARLTGLLGRSRAPVVLGAVAPASGLPSPAAPSADSPKSLVQRAVSAVRRQFLFVVLFSACVNLLYLAPSIYMMQVYDRVLATGGMGTLFFVSMVLLLSLAVLGMLDAIRTRILTRTSLRLDRLMSRTILEGAFANSGAGEARSTQAMRDFDTVRQTATGPAALAVLDAPWAPIYVGVCFLIHPALGLLVIAGGVLLVAIALLNERSQRGALRESGEKAAVLAASHEAERQGAEAARALGFRGALIDRHLAARADMLDSQSTAAFSNAGYASVTKFVRILLQSATLGLGAYLAIQREVSPGAIIAATILASRAFAPLEQIVGAWRQIASADTAWKAVKTLLSAMPDKRERTPLPAPRGLVVLEDVAVKAPNAERLLIGEVSARLQPGEIVGVMGPSGAGKSTLARAIAGAAPAYYGVVRMDGASYADWEPEELARHIGYLPQDVQLFAGTVAENIARFQTGPEAAARAVEAATKAGAHEMILRLPDGYNTSLGPLGRGLSFGQAQRIGLARALYGDPALLVLDEPNAHLDAEGEAALIGALKDARARGATCVVVAHRPSTMGVADKVMIIRDGRLDAFGPREQVVSKLTAVPTPPAPPGGPVSFAGAPL